eukprot:2904419-Amphidinium_carterae.1
MGSEFGHVPHDTRCLIYNIRFDDKILKNSRGTIGNTPNSSQQVHTLLTVAVLLSGHACVTCLDYAVTGSDKSSDIMQMLMQGAANASPAKSHNSCGRNSLSGVDEDGTMPSK